MGSAAALLDAAAAMGWHTSFAELRITASVDVLIGCEQKVGSAHCCVECGVQAFSHAAHIFCHRPLYAEAHCTWNMTELAGHL
jgi:hypothetical protein